VNGQRRISTGIREISKLIMDGQIVRSGGNPNIVKFVFDATDDPHPDYPQLGANLMSVFSDGSKRRASLWELCEVIVEGSA